MRYSLYHWRKDNLPTVEEMDSPTMSVIREVPLYTHSYCMADIPPLLTVLRVQYGLVSKLTVEVSFFPFHFWVLWSQKDSGYTVCHWCSEWSEMNERRHTYIDKDIHTYVRTYTNASTHIVCMYVRMYCTMCSYTYVRTYIPTYCIYVCTYVLYIHIHTYVRTSLHTVYIYVCTYVLYIHIRTYVHPYILYMYMYVRMYYTYTYIPTYNNIIHMYTSIHPYIHTYVLVLYRYT